MAEKKQELERFKNATCLIQAVDGSNATGFHYGRGWVMTVAHIFQDNNDPNHFHSLLSFATFTFSISGREIEFDGKGLRLAFVHHLRAGDAVDYKNMDIAMVKLGTQCDRRSEDKLDWERDEESKLNQLQPEQFAKIQDRTLSVNDMVHIIYNKHNDEARAYIRNIEMRRVARVINRGPAAIANGNYFPYIVLQPAISDESGGVAKSGAPILSQDQNLLVGLLYGGDDTEDEALQWNNGILQYTNHGNIIPALTERYFYFRKLLPGPSEQQDSDARTQVLLLRIQLDQLAQHNKLTIYLCNGEKFTGTTTEQN